MLISLDVDNFRSFGVSQNFNTWAVNALKKHRERTVEIPNISKSILKNIIIYGGNGSGKTNVFQALQFIQNMVIDSKYLYSVDAIKEARPFLLDTRLKDSDSTFKIVFLVENKTIYSYTLTVNFTTKKVIYENLRILKKQFSEEIFTRSLKDNKSFFVFESKNPYNNFLKFVNNIVPESATLLSSNFIDEPQIREAMEWIKKNMMFVFHPFDSSSSVYILNKNEKYINIANMILDKLNLGFKKIQLKKIPITTYFGVEREAESTHIENMLKDKDYFVYEDSSQIFQTAIKESNGIVSILKLSTIHQDNTGNDVLFDVYQESKGTINILHLIPLIILSYAEGVNCFIDDVDTSLHAIMIKKIIDTYVENNIKDATGQLIYNTHEDLLLDEEILRQDEVWLVDKTIDGNTILTPFSDFDRIRHDLNWRKNYLNGAFKGVPEIDEKIKSVKFSEYL